MSVLTDALPNTIVIDGRKYKINTDFRVGIQFESMIMSNRWDIEKIFRLYFTDETPEDMKAAFKAIELFYCCGKQREKTAKSEAKKAYKQAYSFDMDAEVIVADFWRFYNIDLTQEGLHWWVFRALLDGLPADSNFRERVYYRTCDLKKLSKNERKRVSEIRSRIEIKQRKEKKTLEARNTGYKDYISRRLAELSGGGVNV